MVQKEIFKAGLGDMYVAQLDIRREREIRDLGNERAAAVGVKIGAIVFRRAHLANTRQRLETLQQFRRVLAEADAHQVSAGNGRLQFLRCAQRDDTTVIDDSEALAEGVSFLHVVSREQNGFAAAVVLANDLPEKQARLRIQSRARLIKEKHQRIVHHGACDGESLHHAAGKSADDLVGAIGELEPLEQRGSAIVAFVGTEAKIGAVKSKNFASR